MAELYEGKSIHHENRACVYDLTELTFQKADYEAFIFQHAISTSIPRS